MAYPAKISDGSNIRPWPRPLLIFRTMQYCGCTVVWAPDYSHNPKFPFVLKHANYLCRHYGMVQHVRDH